MPGTSNLIAPVYSHGGGTTGGQLPAVPGTAVSNGRPVVINGSIQGVAMECWLKNISAGSGTCNFYIEGNGGGVANGQPIADEWFDCSDAGGYTLYYPNNPGANHFNYLAKCLPLEIPFWRTRIASITSGLVLTSYVPMLRINGVWVQAAYPQWESATQNLTSTT